MFTIGLYRNYSEKNKINKDIELLYSLTGNIKEPSSIIEPIITIELPINMAHYNYAYINEFGRYYFVVDAISTSYNMSELHLKVDVLNSFANEILANAGIIKRQENDWNLYLDDGSFKCYQYKTVSTYKLPNGFPTDNDLVLAVAGKVNVS